MNINVEPGFQHSLATALFTILTDKFHIQNVTLLLSTVWSRNLFD